MLELCPLLTPTSAFSSAWMVEWKLLPENILIWSGLCIVGRTWWLALPNYRMWSRVVGGHTTWGWWWHTGWAHCLWGPPFSWCGCSDWHQGSVPASYQMVHLRWCSWQAHATLSGTNLSSKLHLGKIGLYLQCLGSLLLGCHGVQNSSYELFPKATQDDWQCLSWQSACEYHEHWAEEAVDLH